MKKLLNLSLVIMILLCFFAPTFFASAAEAFEVYVENSEGNNLVFSAATYNEAYKLALEKEKEDINNNVIIYESGKLKYATYALLNFKTKSSSSLNTTYTIEFNNREGYTNGFYGADGAFLGTNESGTQIRFMQAGVIGWVNASEVEIIKMDQKNYDTFYMNAYIMTYTDTWELRHNITTDVRKSSSGAKIILGQERPYGMNDEDYYLSYDGHYFYPESLEGYRTMIRDYKAGVRTNSINPNNPYYNYYQFLSHRTISNYTSAQIKQNLGAYTSKVTGTKAEAGESQLYGEEVSFIQYQNEYGANAIMMLGVAKNESANGTSSISISTNNLFGHNAVDSAPGMSANRYATVAQGIAYHAKVYISDGFLDPCDGYTVASGSGNGTSSQCHKGRYFGGNLGDKNSGMNVKYASDPYWGEKAAQNYYYFDKAYGLQDYGKYGIGIKTTNQSYPIKASASDKSATLYYTGPSTTYPVTILGEVEGEEFNGSKVWYKIQSDPTLNAARNGIVQGQATYDYDHNIAYIHSSYLSYVKKGKTEKERYTIKFNPNGGKFSDNHTNTKSLTVEELVYPEIDNPTRDGYKFVGWDKNIEAASEDTTYTAVWEVQAIYDITFDANGGKFSDNSTSKTIKVAKDQMPSFSMSPTKSGYTFVGWDKEIVVATGNTTYKAVYKQVEVYDITFDANGGYFADRTTTKTVKTEKGVKPSFTEEPTKDGYIFTGWDKEIVAATGNTTYKATYKVVNSDEEIESLNENDAFFYLDSITSKNGKLYIKGFQTIEGIDNNLNVGIQYLVGLVDLENPEKVYLQAARRITDSTEMPFNSYGLGNKDYSAAWFELETDFGGVDDGNYIAVVMAYTNHDYSAAVLSNKMFAPQATSYSGKKEVLIRNIYYDNSQPIEFVVRSNQLAPKTTETYTYNQFDQFFELDFNTNNLLHIKGYTYSYGMDLKSSAKVVRNIIFENAETFETTVFSVNAMKGAYDPALPVSDSLSKTLAWYEGNLDLSKLDKGVYRIYLATSSNISDISELTDLFNQDLSNKTKTINGKKYEFRTIAERGNIVVLIVS